MRTISAPHIHTIVSIANIQPASNNNRHLNYDVVINTLSRKMSIEQQNPNDPTTSPQANRGHPLTASNLALHEQNTTTISIDHAIRSWLSSSGSGTSPPVHVDNEIWMGLVKRDPVAAAIEAATRDGGNNSRGQQKR